MNNLLPLLTMLFCFLITTGGTITGWTTGSSHGRWRPKDCVKGVVLERSVGGASCRKLYIYYYFVF